MHGYEAEYRYPFDKVERYCPCLYRYMCQCRMHKNSLCLRCQRRHTLRHCSNTEVPWSTLAAVWTPRRLPYLQQWPKWEGAILIFSWDCSLMVVKMCEPKLRSFYVVIFLVFARKDFVLRVKCYILIAECCILWFKMSLFYPRKHLVRPLKMSLCSDFRGITG